MKHTRVRAIPHLVWIAASLMLAACVPLTPEPAPDPGNTSAMETPQADGHRDEASDDETIATSTSIESEAIMRYEEVTLADGTVMEYAVVLPANFDAAQAYPVLLAMPPGPQSRSMVDFGLNDYWAEVAIDNGWIVLSPAAPGGQLYFRGSERLIPEFLATTATQYRPEGGKVHIAGISNGGISSFRIAGQHPELFHSLLVLPGFPQTDEDRTNMEALAAMPVVMFVGGNDTSWIGPMQAAADRLAELGGDVLFEIAPGEDHVIGSLAGGDRLFELLESFR